MSGRGKKPVPKATKPEASQPASKVLRSGSSKSTPAVVKPQASKSISKKGKTRASEFLPHMPYDLLSDGEGQQTAFIWIALTAHNFHKLAKMVMREICAYLIQETVYPYAVGPGVLIVHNLATEKSEVITSFVGNVNFCPRLFQDARIDSRRVFCCGGISNFHTELTPEKTQIACNDAFALSFDHLSQRFRPMMKARSGHGVVVFKRRAYVFGGGKPDDIRDSVACESFNFGSGTWSSLPNLLFGREQCSVCRLRDRVYLYGGVPEVEVFWLFANTITVADFYLPELDISARIVQGNQLVLLTPTRRITIRQEGQFDIMEVSEEETPKVSGCFSVYWKGKIYSDGGAKISQINATDFREYKMVALIVG